MGLLGVSGRVWKSGLPTGSRRPQSVSARDGLTTTQGGESRLRSASRGTGEPLRLPEGGRLGSVVSRAWRWVGQCFPVESVWDGAGTVQKFLSFLSWSFGGESRLWLGIFGVYAHWGFQ